MVAPFFQSLAAVRLRARLSRAGRDADAGTQLAGGALIVVGVLFVSIGDGPKRERFRWQLAALMLCARLRPVAVDADLQGVRGQGRVLGHDVLDVRRRGAVRRRRFLCIGRYRRQFIELAAGRTATALIAINASNELINLGGGLANRYALIFAPLAIVQAIGSTTTLFVFVFGVLLTLLFPKVSRENLSAREFAQKGIAAVLVAIGVALVSR